MKAHLVHLTLSSYTLSRNKQEPAAFTGAFTANVVYPGMKSLHVDKQLLIVANAHMHWDPEYSDVKLIQTMMFVSELKNILEKASSRPSSPTADPNSIPLVLCADLNSLPDSGKAGFLADF